LQQQLDSLAAQAVLPTELIVCDDASTDGTIKILESFSKVANFKVKIFRNSINLGYVKNFEKAISLCEYEIIFLCDQDDIWANDKIQKLVAVFNAELSVGLIFHGYSNIDSSGLSYLQEQEVYGVSKLNALQLVDDILKNSINSLLLPRPRAWCGCMMAFRRKFNDVIIPIFPGKGHDDWILKVVAPLSDVRFISNPLIGYRIHSGNSNNFEIKKKTFRIHFSRLLRRIERVFMGHSKKSFYRSLIARIAESKFELRRPELIEIYKKFC
jgi:glycosyltransferase involved in cell wall biosynthesis